jgi:hypothetical protein
LNGVAVGGELLLVEGGWRGRRRVRRKGGLGHEEGPFYARWLIGFGETLSHPSLAQGGARSLPQEGVLWVSCVSSEKPKNKGGVPALP